MYAYVAPLLYDAFIGFAAKPTRVNSPNTRATPLGNRNAASVPVAPFALPIDPDPAMTVNVYDDVALLGGSGMEAISTLC
jgi:hypothetical protein